MDPFLENQEVLRSAILDLQPTAYWPLDDGSSPLRDVARGWSATVTGSPTYGVAAPSPIGRGVTFSGTGQYAKSSTSVPTPSASVSVLVLLRTAMEAGGRFALSRWGTASGERSWGLQMTSGFGLQFNAYQADGTSHAGTALSGTTARNDGLWHLAVATFDGTTIRGYCDNLDDSSSTSLSGTWHKASAGAISIGVLNTTNLWVGTLAHLAYWSDRVITDAERLWLHSIAFGG